MKNKKVSLAAGLGRKENIRKCLGLIIDDIREIETKQHILIKPNLTATIGHAGANTALEALEAVLEFLYSNFPSMGSKEVVVADGSGSAFYEKTSTEAVLKDMGYFELVKKYKNLKIEWLENYPAAEYFPVEIRSIAGPEKVLVANRIKDFDYKISINLPKVHNYAIATFGIKNMLGFIRQEDKSLIHGLRTPSAPGAKSIFTYIPTSAIAWGRRHVPWLVNMVMKGSGTYLKAMKVIHHNVAQTAKHIWPDLVVIDAMYGMDGCGPVDGYLVELNAAAASADALKADGVAARLIGIEPEEVGYLTYLYKEGLGDYSLEGLVGDDPKKIAKRFHRHPTYHIQCHWKD